jgi:polysaccharide export outer membrane protein
LLKIDLEALVGRGDLSANCVLEDGDVVHVPPSAQIFVMGQVKQGGAFPLKGEITLLKAIALAGGLKDEATPSATVLIRMTESGRETIPIDLTEVEAGSEKDVKLQAEDVLVVSETPGNRFLRNVGSFLQGIFHIGYAL